MSSIARPRRRLRGIAAGTLLALAAGLGVWAYQRYAAPTRIAFVNYSEFQLARIHRANEGAWVRIDALPPERLERARRYRAVYVFGRGLHLAPEQREALRAAGAAGVHVYVDAPMSAEADLTNLVGEPRERIAGYFRNGGTRNYRHLLGYTRRVLDGKRWRAGEAHPPEPIPEDVFFYLDEAVALGSAAALEAYLRQHGRYREGAPRIALLTSVPGPFNANRDHLEQLISTLEARGLNVYPIAARRQRLTFLQQVEPDLVVYLPHGRLGAERPEEMLAWLRARNVPVLAPLSVFQPYDAWMADPKGMFGSMLTMNVVLPEIDGAVAPFVIAAQYADAQGYQIFDAVPERVDAFGELVERWVSLRRKPNHEKRIAIYYFKGPGLNALTAGGLEVVPSLYALLRRLREEGYRVEGLPASEREFAERIQRQGLVLEPYAKGAIDEFLRAGDPALVEVDTYLEWVRRGIRSELYRQAEEKYGRAPGDYLVARRDGRDRIAVARVQFGNVVLLPQPLPAVGDNTFQLVHGAGVAPPHPYLASYLWTRYGFGADAILHFGTHGSLEFLPGKQIALSSRDWSDALIGAMPHLYVYTVSNVGEGIIAKRRSYATTLTHLTPPFQEGGTYDELTQLEERLHTYASLAEGPLKAEYVKTISQQARQLDLYPALRLDPVHDLTEEQIFELTNLVEEIAYEKVPGGLYTLGRGYRAEQILSTVRLMTVDPIAHALADLDAVGGRVREEQLRDALFFNQRYRSRAAAIIDRVLADSAALARELDRLASPADRARAQAAAARSRAELEPREQRFAQAVLRLEEALTSIPRYRAALEASSRAELDAVIHALGGGFVPPSPGGDPVRNPASVPTGRNLFSIDAERTPTPEAWAVGVRLAESLLETHFAQHGRYPRKVSFTLWPGEFIATEGATVAQVLYLLGVEPVRDPAGRVADVRLIAAEQLGRPRIDVVLQTAGQLRDLAASRLFLINKAVALAAEAQDGAPGENYVREGALRAEQVMKAHGLSPREARNLSTARIFGGIGGAYGTNIMGLVESGDRWADEGEVARTYLNNMGALYGKADAWGDFHPGVFEAALQNTEVVVHPRESNTWGPLSLDHVYEFMGGLSLAVRHVTGRDPDAYFNDFRNPSRPRVQELTEAVWVEARSTLLNPGSIREYLRGGASSAEKFAETFRNVYGWNVMKPAAIDEALWNQLHEVYVRDRHALGLHEFFERENPYALQEMTAVMLETARKGYWKATPAQLRELATLHALLVQAHGAGCSGFVCDNAPLREAIRAQLDPPLAEAYEQRIAAAREPAPASEGETALTLEPERLRVGANEAVLAPARRAWLLAAGLALLAALVLFIVRRRREATWSRS